MKLGSLTVRDSIVASIPACHAGDRGSIPRLGVFLFWSFSLFWCNKCLVTYGAERKGLGQQKRHFVVQTE